MKIERFEIPGLAAYSYVVSSDGYAAVIDPMREIDRYMRFLEQQGLQLSCVLETHIHADFASGAKTLAAQSGARLLLSAYDQSERYRYAMPHGTLRDGESITVGSVRLEARHTPGHTPEHLSFLVYDSQQRNIEPVAIFSGDFLLAGSLGRPDLLGEDAKQSLARSLYVSLHRVLDPLPDSVRVYPGHGAGSLCGAGIEDRVESTLGLERRANPLFALDEGAFVAKILGSVPPMPSYYPRMKELNGVGAAPVSPLPGGERISPAALRKLLADQRCVVLDVRRPEAFADAHIPGAVNIGGGQGFASWAGWLLEAGARIVLVNEAGKDEEARSGLVSVGIDSVLGSLDGGMPAWIDAGFDCAGTPQVSASELRRAGPEIVIVDVRNDTEWQAGHIPGARRIMLGDLIGQMAGLPQDGAIVMVCGGGYRASIAASLLARAGFGKVSVLQGGMNAWYEEVTTASLCCSA